MYKAENFKEPQGTAKNQARTRQTNENMKTWTSILQFAENNQQPTSAAHKRHVPKWGGGGVTPHGVFNILHIWTYLHISGHIWAYLLIFGISGHICTYLLYLDISWRSCLYLAYLDLSRHTLCTWEYLAVSAHMWHIWAYLCISVCLWAYLAYLGDEIIFIYEVPKDTWHVTLRCS